MNIAMDTIAGEKERHSLLPLLLNPVRRLDFAIGKWLAVSFFAVAGLAINLLGFVAVFANSGIGTAGAWPLALAAIAIGVFPLALLAAALQLLISTMSRAVKEAQTYLSMIVFLPMGLGMFLVFYPAAARGWCRFLPIVGQQLQLEAIMNGRSFDMLQPIALGCLTATFAIVILLGAANRLKRDEVIFGN
jgi:sodium transport system permease protein